MVNLAVGLRDERRIWAIGLVGLLALALVLFAGVHLVSSGSQVKLTGTTLGNQPAPDFHLHDAGGQAYSLDQFRGKTVVLTFFYTHCQDVCPLEAEVLRHADEAAGHPSNAVYLAVSVDPVGDTPQSIATFEQEHQLAELGSRWHYLIGTQQLLQNVWHSYGIYAPPQPADPNAPNHSVGFYVIDKQGRERVYSDPDITAEQLAQNELAVLKG